MSNLNVADAHSPLYYDGSHGDHTQEKQQYLIVNRAQYTPAGVLNLNNSVITFQVPAIDMFSNMALQIGGLTSLTANQDLSVGWGFNCIDNIKVQIGNSDVITYHGTNLFHNAMSDCADESKRQQMLTNAGLASSVAQDAIIPLTLLWSRLMALRPKLPFPAYMVSAGMNLQIQLRNPCEGSASTSYDTNFSTCRLLLRSVIDKSGGIQLKQGQVYHYPCSIGSFFKNNVTGSTSTASRCSVQLSSFYAGRLRNIKILAVETTSSTTNQWTKAARLQNIRLLQAGQVLYDFPSVSSDVFEGVVNMSSNVFTAGGAARYFYNLNLAALDNVNINMSHNGINLSNQFLTLEFTTPNTNNFDIYVFYEYSGSIIVADKNAMISYVQ